MPLNLLRASLAILCIGVVSCVTSRAAEPGNAGVDRIVAQTIEPLMKQYGIPGMAVGIIAQGKSHFFFYGVASKTTGRPIDSDTLFEIGSLSKTFTATLASYAVVTGRLSLSDSPGKYLPWLRGSNLAEVSLLNLGTHTAGGLPLQVPSEIHDDKGLMAYFQAWKPDYPPGTYRLYSNPSIGLLGLATAASLKRDFSDLIQADIFKPLGMENAYLNVPANQIKNYAQGYSKADAPIRMSAGPLAPEAYGIRTTTADLTRFIDANMQTSPLGKDLQRAIIDTHTGYFKVGAMTQDLIWEQYSYPVELKDLLAGNSAKISYEANPADRIDPPSPPREDVLINKTGSTNGFAAYAAFIPKEKAGIVLLANKNYPIDARVTAAYEILTGLIAMVPAAKP